MGIAAAVFVDLLGLLAAYPALESRFPRLHDVISPLVPYQSGIGMVAALLGAVAVVVTLIGFGQLHWAPLFWLLDLAVGLLVMGLGLLLGHDLLTTSLFSGNAAAQKAAAALRDRLLPHQIRLGYAGILMGTFITLLHIAY